uniref:Uncharacterized protein n=1 Tax=Trypanosoma congolense (strain IL3000) TaxID=1068625 RepID=G0UL64_TRYCI|nr:conserved hypothetical protein [Trypanosoma congolense IL3000]
MPGNLRPVSPYQEQNRPLDQMTDDELRREMVQLVRMNAQLAEESAGLQADIGALCEESVRFQQSTEIEEDKLTNQLLRRLQSEEVQKHRFHRQILREEEARRQIMDQIARVRQQKAELENQLVHEQEMQRMGLQKKLIDVVNKKIEMERRLLNERHAQLEALTTKLALIKECTLAAKTKSDVMCDDPKAVESTVASQSPTRGDTAVGGPVVPHVAGASTPQRAAGTSATGSTPPTLLSDNGGDDVDAAITRLEEQLSRLLEQHAIATQTNASNETLYTELGRNLESIQQAASIDKAHTLKLRNELMEAKKRVALLEQRAAAGAVYAASDDSSDMQTPSVSSI